MTAPASDSWGLIAAAQQGDRDAFGQLYEQYAPGVSRFVGSRLRDRGLVEDLTSETFTRALRRLDSVTDQGRDVGAWLTTIAKNLIYDNAKSSRTRLETTTAEIQDADTHQASPEQAVLEKETREELHRHVAALTPAQRECIQRRFLGELSPAETATAMDRNVGAVKALQHRGIVALRASLTAGRIPPPRDKPDQLAQARRAVTDVAEHVASTDPDTVESDRAGQLAHWHADDQAAVHKANAAAPEFHLGTGGVL